MTVSRVPGSFRDPNGFLFRRDGVLYRQINEAGSRDLELLETSGLHDELVQANLVVAHETADPALAAEPGAKRVIRPEPVDFVSYPYEWCFGELKDAALLTLEIQHRAVGRGLSLKDASAYNVQFHRGTPVLIDSLSFEAYQDGRPWVAYRQFCQHFLAPIALMAKRDVRLGRLLRLHIDGVPLDLAASLLPASTRFSFGLQVHLHAHARAQREPRSEGGRWRGSMSTALDRRAHLHFLEDLRNTIDKLSWKPEGSEWSDYDAGQSYGEKGLTDKLESVARFVEEAAPGSVWDLGANVGRFSRLASDRGICTVAWDADPAAIELNYRQVVDQRETALLPLWIDLTNPSPALGWESRERLSLEERGPADLVLALALIHHLAISNNVPLGRIAECFARLGRHVLVEFVPKEDPQVQRLLESRVDVFPSYNLEGFEEAFGRAFHLVGRATLEGSKRTLYLWKGRSPEESQS